MACLLIKNCQKIWIQKFQSFDLSSQLPFLGKIFTRFDNDQSSVTIFFHIFLPRAHTVRTEGKNAHFGERRFFFLSLAMKVWHHMSPPPLTWVDYNKDFLSILDDDFSMLFLLSFFLPFCALIGRVKGGLIFFKIFKD